VAKIRDIFVKLTYLATYTTSWLEGDITGGLDNSPFAHGCYHIMAMFFSTSKL
jgi:hypothetical protein